MVWFLVIYLLLVYIILVFWYRLKQTDKMLEDIIKEGPKKDELVTEED